MLRLATIIAVVLTAGLILSGCGGGGGPAPAGTDITGTVIASGTSEPLSGVQVTAVEATKSVTTGSAGTFTLTGIAPGTYTFTFTKSGYDQVSRQITVVSGTNPPIEQTLRPAGTGLPPGQGVPRDIEGVVRLSDTTDYSGVTVELMSASTVVETFTPTGADGKYHFWAAPGSYAVRFSKTGYATRTYGVVLVKDIAAIVTVPTITLQKQ